MRNLTNLIFSDEEKAREHFEAIRWPNGPYCPHCGETDKVYRLNGKSHRAGLLHCNSCDQAFTVTVGTVMERSHVPLNKWALAYRLMCSSKKGLSARQMHRTIEVTYKTAWFMCHRIRESMRDLAPENGGHLGGANKVVEVDEMYVGGKETNKHAAKRLNAGNGAVGKEPVVSLVERDGRVRSHHVKSVNAKTLRPILEAHIHKATHVMTDEAAVYPSITRDFAGHSTVNHGIEGYVRCGGFIHTNTIESYFAIFKRGVYGTFHHVSEQHLKRYLCEFDFKYNERSALGIDDDARTAKAIKGSTGKRVTHQAAGQRGAQASA